MSSSRTSRSAVAKKENARKAFLEEELPRFLKGLCEYQASGTGGAKYEQALVEIQRGTKIGHWIWYVFPQAYPSSSNTGKNCQIRQAHCLDVAEAILDHDILGPNFVKITNALQSHNGKRSIKQIVGVDDVKVRSCLTLFSRTRGNRPGKKEAALALSSFFTDECPATKGYIKEHYPDQ